MFIENEQKEQFENVNINTLFIDKKAFINRSPIKKDRICCMILNTCHTFLNQMDEENLNCHPYDLNLMVGHHTTMKKIEVVL